MSAATSFFGAKGLVPFGRKPQGRTMLKAFLEEKHHDVGVYWFTLERPRLRRIKVVTNPTVKVFDAADRLMNALNRRRVEKLLHHDDLEVRVRNPIVTPLSDGLGLGS
jgi:hypothetical protein